jgi:HEAT repeat protein
VRPGDLEPFAGPVLSTGKRDGTWREHLAWFVFWGHRSVIPIVRKALAEESSEELRLYLADVLSSLGSPAEAVPVFRKALESESDTIRADAVDSLAGAAGKGEMAALFRALEDRSHLVRMRTVVALARIGATEAVPELRKRLGDVSSQVRETVPGALAELGAREAIPDLVGRLGDGDEDVVRRVHHALVRLRAREAAPELLKLLKDSDPEKRASAGNLLLQICGKEAAAEVARLAHAGSPAERIAGLRALRALGDGKAVRKALKDPDAKVRDAAIEAVAALNVRDAIPDLLGMAGHERAEQTLLEMKAREAIPLLVGRLTDQEEAVQVGAAAQLVLWGRDEGRRAIAAWLDSKDVDERGRGLRAVADGQLAEFAPKIGDLLKAKEPEILEAALALLGRFGARDRIPEIRKLLQAHSDELPAAAAEALGLLGDRESIPAIRKLMAEGDPSMRSTAALALCRLGDRASAPAVRELLMEDYPTARAALGALRILADRDAVPFVRNLFAGEKDERKVQLGAWLAQFGSRDGVGVLVGEESAPGVLNALRSPDAWAKLCAPRPIPYREGTLRELVEAHARDAGFKVEWDRGVDPDPSIRTSFAFLDDSDLLPAAAVALDWHLRDGGWTWVLEGDVLRILPADEALRFWKDWGSR